MPQNGMSNQTLSAKVRLDLCGLEPDPPWPFPGERRDLFGALRAAPSSECRATRRLQKRRRRVLGESRKDEVLVEGFPLSPSHSLFPPMQGVLSVYGVGLLREIGTPPAERSAK